MRKLKEAVQGGETLTPVMPDFSERYLTWMAYSTAIEEKEKDTILRYPYSPIDPDSTYTHPIYDMGGDGEKATLTLLNKGVVNEEEAPYKPFMDDFAAVNEALEGVIEEARAKNRAGIWDIDIANDYFQKKQIELKRQKMGQETYGAIEKTISPNGALRGLCVSKGIRWRTYG